MLGTKRFAAGYNTITAAVASQDLMHGRSISQFDAFAFSSRENRARQSARVDRTFAWKPCGGRCTRRHTGFNLASLRDRNELGGKAGLSMACYRSATLALPIKPKIEPQCAIAAKLCRQARSLFDRFHESRVNCEAHSGERKHEKIVRGFRLRREHPGSGPRSLLPGDLAINDQDTELASRELEGQRPANNSPAHNDGVERLHKFILSGFQTGPRAARHAATRRDRSEAGAETGVSLKRFNQFDGDQLRLLSQILRTGIVGGLQSFACLSDESSDLFHHFLLCRAQLVDASLLQIFLGLADAVIRPVFVRGLIRLGDLRRNLGWCRA
jgi:hypothetical protein